MALGGKTSEVKARTPTSDAFLGGALTLSQPASGFRAGSDSVLLGASVDPDSTRIADLGAGAGAAGLIALYWCPKATGLLVEKQPEISKLAQANIEANGCADRARATHLDIEAPGPERQRAGLVPDHFTSVIANPPFFEAARGTKAPVPERAAARHMDAGALDRWVKVAAGAAAPGGEVIFVHRVAALPSLLAAFSARFGAIEVWPIQPRPGHAAKSVLVRGIKGSRAPMKVLPPLVLHGEAGHHFRPEVADVLMGRAKLQWPILKG